MNLLAQRTDPDAKIPVREHPTDAGIDFFALKGEMINPGDRKLVSTGIRLQIPPGHVLFLKDKSGISTTHGVHIMAGVIDEDYRGEIKVLMINHGSGRYVVEKGKKICQGVLLPVSTPVVEETLEISTETSRGEGGFGSTGDDVKEEIKVHKCNCDPLEKLEDIKHYIQTLQTERDEYKKEISALRHQIGMQYIKPVSGA